MCDCTKKIRWGKVFFAALVFVIISVVVRQIEAVLTMSYYLDPAYFPIWSKLMMPSAGPPPPSFLLTSLLFSFVTGVVLAAFYDLYRDSCPKKLWTRVLCFTGAIAVLSLVFFTLPVYLMINLPLGLLLSWFVSTIVIIFLGALVFARILR